MYGILVVFVCERKKETEMYAYLQYVRVSGSVETMETT